MKNVLLILLSILILPFFTACNGNDDEDVDGTLSVKLRVWNSHDPGTMMSFENRSETATTPIRLPFTDILGYKYEMKVTTDVIQEGMNESDLNWTTIYTSETLMGDSQRDFQFNLPPGQYKGFAFWQSKDFHWVCDHNGTPIHIPVSNSGSGDRIYNAFGTNGLYVLDDNGQFVRVQNNEQVGTAFMIDPGQETEVTVRVNFIAIDWFDNDGNGIWSTGDTASDPMLPDGVTTMADFLVVYE